MHGACQHLGVRAPTSCVAAEHAVLKNVPCTWDLVQGWNARTGYIWWHLLVKAAVRTDWQQWNFDGQQMQGT